MNKQLGSTVTYLDVTVTLLNKISLRALQGRTVTATCSPKAPNSPLHSAIISHTRYDTYLQL